jgi:hypothetical protein
MGLKGYSVAVCAALCVVAPNVQAQTWVPNETRASAQTDLIDYEFSQSRGQFVWSDCCGGLWIGNVDRTTGKFSPADGKGLLIDPDSMTFDDAQKTKNGPEWVTYAGGDLLVYTKYNGRHSDNNSRLGFAYPLQAGSSCSHISADGYWCAGMLGPDLVRKAPYGSSVTGDTAPLITYVDNRERHYWRELLDATTERPIPDFPDSNYPIRLPNCGVSVPGVRSALYGVTVDGVQQVTMRDFDTGVVTQLTFDAGNKYEMFMWCAPEFGNELLFMTVVDSAELRVYRNLPSGQGAGRAWTPIFSQFAPIEQSIASPEPFTYNGKSYIFMSQVVQPNVFRSEVWISNIDAAAPIFRRITPLEPLVSRTDPEVFITDNGPYIYFNMLKPGTRRTGGPRACRDPSCSLGVWFADPGLKLLAP